MKMEASPINPSDMWPMFGPANLSKALLSNEGAGVVVAAGDSEQAQVLIGKTVALF